VSGFCSTSGGALVLVLLHVREVSGVIRSCGRGLRESLFSRDLFL
jgi:hypothetical protein